MSGIVITVGALLTATILQTDSVLIFRLPVSFTEVSSMFQIGPG